MDSGKFDDESEMSDHTVPAAYFKAKFSDIIEELPNSGPVIVSIRNKPRAVVTDIRYHRDLLAKAAAYELLKLYEEAEAGEKFTPAELESFLDQRSEDRSRVRQAA